MTRAEVAPVSPEQAESGSSFHMARETWGWLFQWIAMAESPDEFRTLLQRAKEGEPEALAQLTQRYEPQVRIVARVLLGPALRPFLDSIDLVQSVHRAFLLGLRQDQFSLSNPEKLVKLALTLVRRKVAHHWRRVRRQRRLEHGAVETNDLASLFTSLSSAE